MERFGKADVAEVAGHNLDHELVLHRRVRALEIDAEPPMSLSADGEAVGETPVRYEIRPGAVRFVAPAPTGR